MAKVKTFEAACKKLKIQPVLPDVSMLPESKGKGIIALYKLEVIAEAMNEGWVPDWSNSKEWKYYPWFKYNSGSGSSGFGLSLCDYVFVCTSTLLGSRLVFKSIELAKYAGDQFKELYQEYFLIKE